MQNLYFAWMGSVLARLLPVVGQPNCNWPPLIFRNSNSLDLKPSGAQHNLKWFAFFGKFENSY